MPVTSTLICLSLALFSPGDGGPPWPDPAPSLEQIFRAPTLLGQRPSRVGISADGRWVSFDWSPERTQDADEGEGADRTRDATDTNSNEAAEDAATEAADIVAEADEPEQPGTWLVNTSSGETHGLGGPDDDVRVHWTGRGSLALVERDGWLELYDPADDGVRSPLFQTGGGVSLTMLEDDVSVLLRSADNQLWLLDLERGTRRALAPELEQRSRWFDVEPRAGVVAVLASHASDDGRDGEHSSERSSHHDEGLGGARNSNSNSNSNGNGNGSDDANAGDRRLQLLPLHPPTDDGDGALRVTQLSDEGSFDLSPDGRWVLVTQREPGASHELIMADYLTPFVSTVPVRSSLAGDPSPRRTLELYEVETGHTHALRLDGDERPWMLRSQWSPDGARLLIERVSGDTHVRQLLVLDPATRSATLVHSERDEAWIGGPFLWSGWREQGGEVLFTSERSGFNHLYAVSPDGGEPRALTQGEFEVARVTLLEDLDQALLVAHGEDDPAITQLLLVSLEGGEQTRLTGSNGCATRPLVSHDGSSVAFRWSTLGVPWELHALRMQEGGGPLALSQTVPDELAALELPPPELISYSNPDDGVSVHAYLYRPVPFDPALTYPAVMFVHGAGYLQQVQRSMSSYEPNMLFHHRLTRMGFAVIDADFRHSRGYGRDFRAGIHGFMGGKDLDDCVAGVDFLGTLGWVDTERVGLYGGSYGGFLTLMALFTQPDVFAAGAALRSVTDWRVYSHWYTTPRLGDPVEDAENYARSSPIDHVDGLSKPLLLLHGLKDPNVFAQDTIRLIEALIERGKDFDAMLYPSQGHGFTDADSWIDEYKRIERLFVRELKPGE